MRLLCIHGTLIFVYGTGILRLARAHIEQCAFDSWQRAFNSWYVNVLGFEVTSCGCYVYMRHSLFAYGAGILRLEHACIELCAFGSCQCAFNSWYVHVLGFEVKS